MVVMKGAVDEFLKRKLKRSSRVKRLTHKQLLRRVSKLDLSPDFVYPPFIHQLSCFLLGLKYPGYLFFLDPGMGKTKVSLDLFQYRLKEGTAKRALVLVPFSTNVFAWEMECEKHAPRVRAVGMTGTRVERLNKLYDLENQIVIMTYAAMRRMASVVKGKKLVFDRASFRESLGSFDFVIYDESTEIKGHQTLTARIGRRLLKSTSYRYALTGLPFGRNPEDLWSQFYSVDGGETLGETLGLFRAAFFREEERSISYQEGDRRVSFKKKDYIFVPRKKKLLGRMIQHRSIRYSDEETMDLPSIVGGISGGKGFMIRPVKLPAEARAYQRNLIKELDKARGNFKLLKGAFVRMRQLASGFLPYLDPEGERREIVFKENPKLESFLSLVREIPEDRRIIVFNEFKRSGAMLLKGLRDEGFEAERIYSGTAGANQIKYMEAFDAGDLRILIGSRKIAFGLNLQIANYGIFYESPVSPILRKQMERRMKRPGQKRKMFLWDLVVQGSVEERILDFLRMGKNLFKAIVEDGSKCLRKSSQKKKPKRRRLPSGKRRER
jgi:SNF2 family DNA or RNA helicase